MAAKSAASIVPAATASFMSRGASSRRAPRSSFAAAAIGTETSRATASTSVFVMGPPGVKANEPR